ncbi:MULTISPECIES: response regulator transcription factor [unclassified Paraburkholderia]|uniref:response regulator transcription factor n=1 Tax=unclassified Paraburkholderia TaxID=2615204 RepID=UPI002AB146D3|nr:MULTISPECIES: response regulator [unclassified Paraburkholderia]
MHESCNKPVEVNHQGATKSEIEYGSRWQRRSDVVNSDSNRTIHVVEDDASMRSALKRLLSTAGYPVRTYASAGEFLVSEPEGWSGCLLVDLELGGPSGLDLQQALRRQPRALPVVFMSAYSDVPRTVQAMKAGAVDFLVKPFERETLLDALDAAFDAQAHELPTPVASAPDVNLGDRERTVLTGIVAGRRNKQIAADLGLSERTIKSCRADLMRKLGAASFADLLRRADSLSLAA